MTTIKSDLDRDDRWRNVKASVTRGMFYTTFRVEILRDKWPYLAWESHTTYNEALEIGGMYARIMDALVSRVDRKLSKEPPWRSAQAYDGSPF